MTYNRLFECVVPSSREVITVISVVPRSVVRPRCALAFKTASWWLTVATGAIRAISLAPNDTTASANYDPLTPLDKGKGRPGGGDHHLMTWELVNACH